MPWEEKPAGCRDVVWRSKRNPIIPRDLIPRANSIFNSAVVPFKDGFAGVFRVDDRRRRMLLHVGSSRDGIAWTINEEPIHFVCDDPEIGQFEYGYDPRVCWIEDRYYVTWCNGYHGPTIGVAFTRDFETFHLVENAFLPYNRNGVLFPRTINGSFAMLSRPSDTGHTAFGDVFYSASDTGHTAFGDVFYSESPDLCHWGRHRFVMGTRPGWDSTKVGAGPVPIETAEGWLLIYHGVLTSCNGYVYSFGAALLDLDQPWKVRWRGAPYVMNPRELYECAGDTPNVVFPCAALCDAPTGRLAVYYGAADTVTCIAFARVDELITFVKSNADHW
jgi:beta-1,4-mannooligosaccharide/beta-1,4-mannosyl-N-acetylglucosamine phosphorylase